MGIYIHKTYQGYKGEVESTKKYLPLMNQAEEARKNKINEINSVHQNLSDEEEIQNLQDFFNYILNYANSKKNGTRTLDKEKYGINKEELENFLKEFNEAFVKQYKAFQLNQSNILNPQRRRGTKNLNGEIFKKKTNTTSISLKKLIELNKEIENRTKILNNILTEEEKNKIKKFQVEIENIINDVKSQQNSKKETFINIKKIENPNFIQELNDIIDLLSVEMNMKYAIGASLEIFLDTAINFFIGKLPSQIENAFKKSNKLGGKSDIAAPIIFTNYFSQQGKDKLKEIIKVPQPSMNINGKNINLAKNFMVTMSAGTENKADLYLNYKDQDLGLSAKNYYLNPDLDRFHGINLVQQQSLFNFLQTENSKNFFIHYLTLIQPLSFYQTDNELEVENLKQNYNMTVFKLIVLKAISGYNVAKMDLQTQQLYAPAMAKYLIINNRKQKNNSIKILSVKQILSTIEENENILTNSIEFKINDNDYNYKSFKNYSFKRNTEIMTAEERINNILINAHNQKIKVKLTKQGLQEIGVLKPSIT